MKNTNQKKGFTLIELLVVIAIIALLSSVVLAAVQSARQKAQISKANSEISEFIKALEIYKTSYGHYPSSESCIGGGTEGCYSSYGATGDGPANDLSIVLNELKSRKIYSGDLLNTLKSIPNYNAHGEFFYTSTPIGMSSVLSIYPDGLSPFCNKKLALTGLNEYYVYFQTFAADESYPAGLDGTYVGKEYDSSGTPTTYYCAPNN